MTEYWRWVIHRAEAYDAVEVFLFRYVNGKSYSCKFENGRLELTEVDQYARHDPIVTLDSIDASGILQGLAEGLAEAGYVAEVDNAERITAQAVAEERKEQIGWLRGSLEELWDK